MFKNLIILLVICIVTAAGTLMLSSGSLLPAKPITDFSYTSLDNTGGKLSQFKDQPVVLHFWATWCAPCLEELPQLITKANETPSVTFLLISVDQTREVTRAFLDKLVVKPNANIMFIHDPKMTLTSGIFNVSQFPESLILSADHTVQRHVVGSADWKTLVLPIK